MNLFLSGKIKNKLANKIPPVAEEEVVQCFANRTGPLLEDTREDHRTNPPSLWFISETNTGRRLKVIFMRIGDEFHIKSAYEPEEAAVAMYNRYRR